VSGVNWDRLGNDALTQMQHSGKITRMTDDKQIDAMKSNLQATGQRTTQSGNYYDFYKNRQTVLIYLEPCFEFIDRLFLKHIQEDNRRLQ
jgi:hypothetical protein